MEIWKIISLGAILRDGEKLEADVIRWHKYKLLNDQSYKTPKYF
jgi:hypothetical protein